MKLLPFVFILLVGFTSCKKETTDVVQPPSKKNAEDVTSTIQEEPADPDILQNQVVKHRIKKKQLIQKKDEKKQLKELVLSKKIYEEDDEYILDYTYPYLNEEVDANYAVFNNYLRESYLNVERTINEILEDEELLCDTLKIDRFREKRIIDYKLHSTANNVISILLYKENFYSGMRHSAYLFDCLNYNTKDHSFIYFKDFFIDGAEAQIFDLINQTITNDIDSGDMFYDCWQLTEMDFRAYKNNFVINGEFVEFYFDDCVICPSYTGTYSIKLPLPKILHLIKQYQQPLLL
ncbi:RsiV family protein [uncultured Dokdonia sp.]|uniref:RsiV family protein n=1 Tax=uncultured Dokdonia sp. TaxID=575653 RepID=UPI0026054926|nr:RsiV family protein [uncultured Dokdonia sp.]